MQHMLAVRSSTGCRALAVMLQSAGSHLGAQHPSLYAPLYSLAQHVLRPAASFHAAPAVPQNQVRQHAVAAHAKRATSPAPTAPVVENIEEKELHQEAAEAYLSYAMSVIVGRALPDVRDGLKPVHRRILYAMRSLGLTHTKPYKKCARVVGEVLGKYHPHGDTAVYDALVRLAQDFSMEVPLISGHGNFGSLDDDPPAAMRYTECRLAGAAEELLLADLDQDTVDWGDNFDASEREPLVLPAKVPHLLVNGAQGIAVGIATKIPPHNLREVVAGLAALVDNPGLSDAELMQYIPAPDFPTGGIILADHGIANMYTTGSGSILLRAKVDIEYEGAKRRRPAGAPSAAAAATGSRRGRGRGATSRSAADAGEEGDVDGKALIVVTEMPYQTNKAALAAKIAELVEAKQLEGVADVRDESDRSGVRLVVEVKRGTSPQLVLAQLYKTTRLQQRFSANMVALVDGVPRTLTLRQFLVNFLEFRVGVVERRARHQLGVAQERLHLVEGYLSALSQLDGVVQAIRNAADGTAARQQLCDTFHLSERQAEGVLSLTLRRLTAMEAGKLQEEQRQLQATISDLQGLLGDRQRVLAFVKEEAAAVAAKHGSARRSVLEVAAPDQAELSGLALVPNTPSLVSFTRKGYIKRVPTNTYSPQRRGGKGMSGGRLREADVLEEVVPAMAHDTLLLLAGSGRCYTLPAYKVPQSTRTAAGTAAVQLLGLSQPIELKALMAVPEFSDTSSLLLATSAGAIKRLPLAAFAKRRKDGLAAINLAAGDEVCAATVCEDGATALLASSAGRVLHMPTSVLRERGRTAGAIKGIKLGAGQTLVSMVVLPPGAAPAAEAAAAGAQEGEASEEEEPSSQEEEEEAAATADSGPWLLCVTTKGKGKRVPVSAFSVKGRGGQGVMGMKLASGDRLCAAVLVADPVDQLLLASKSGLVTRVCVEEVRTMGRAAAGVRLMQLGPDDEVQTVAVVPEHHHDA